MGNADYKDRLAGSATGAATGVLVGTAPVLIAPARDSRISLTAQADSAPIYLGIASSFNASTARIAKIAVADDSVEERDWRGAVYAKTEGATAVVNVWDVFS